MLLVIMTRSLIRLDSAVRASLNVGLNGHDEAKASSKVHDEEKNESYARTGVNDDGITNGITNGYD